MPRRAAAPLALCLALLLSPAARAADPAPALTQPTDPITRPADPVTRTAGPATRPIDPISRPADPVTRPGDPVTLEAAGLVDIARVAPDIRLDMRYATPDNFTHVAVYPAARCLLRADVAKRLARVQAALEKEGLGLKVFDCYRPFSIQKKFWALVPNEDWVAKPVEKNGKPVSGSKHNRGAAVDLTLVTASGGDVPMPSGFDDFTAKARRDYAGGAPAARANAKRLEAAMVKEGFAPLPSEWWHFDGPGWQGYGLLDVPIN